MSRLLTLLCLCALAACSVGGPAASQAATSPPATAAPAPGGETAQVELDVFSGRPNPSWALSDIERATFIKLAAGLATTAEQAYPGRLGYRGMMVSLRNDAGGELIWRVWGHVAQRTSGATTAYYGDPQQRLQKWLLQAGQPHLAADLFETVQADVTANP